MLHKRIILIICFAQKSRETICMIRFLCFFHKISCYVLNDPDIDIIYTRLQLNHPARFYSTISFRNRSTSSLEYPGANRTISSDSGRMISCISSSSVSGCSLPTFSFNRSKISLEFNSDRNAGSMSIFTARYRIRQIPVRV